MFLKKIFFEGYRNIFKLPEMHKYVKTPWIGLSFSYKKK